MMGHVRVQDEDKVASSMLDSVNVRGTYQRRQTTLLMGGNKFLNLTPPFFMITNNAALDHHPTQSELS